MVVHSILRLPKGLCLQWIAGAIVTTMEFVLGLSIGWASPYLADFLSEDSPFPVTPNEIYWIQSLSQLGRIAGAILGAVCAQYYGSKRTLLGSGCGLLISWVFVIVANSVTWIYVARFIFGSCFEVSGISFPLYLGDISSANIRGALVVLAANGATIGILMGNAMGAFLPMKIFACVALPPNILFLSTFYWIPDSPYYLTSKGKVKDAERSIRMYNPNVDVQAEVESIRKFVSGTNSMTLMDRLREFNVPRNRRSGIIVCVLAMLLACSGMSTLMPFMESIMIRGQVTVIAPSTVPIIANGLGLTAGWTLMYLAEKFGRRTMWAVSSAGVCGAMTSLGAHFYLLAMGFDPTALQWIPIFSLLTYKVFLNLGLSSIGHILCGELFASNIRTLAASVIAISSATFGFATIYGYQLLLPHMQEAYIYWIHAILMFISLIVGTVFIPETKGKTLVEIQTDLGKN